MMAEAAKKLEAGGLDDMMESARAASGLLKALASENRLLLLCLLAEGEKSVSELKQRRGLRHLRARR